MSLTVTDLGTIVSIAKNVEKGYTRLVIDNPVPWKTRYLKFNVWRTAKLCHDHSIPFKTGDMVSVEYTQDQNFNRLISLEPLQSTQVDSCLVCHALYELPRDGQKIDCGYCSIFDSNRRKRLNCELKLIAISEKQCKHSVGLCLTFADNAREELYFAWSFGGNPMREAFQELKLQETYGVIGWIIRRADNGDEDNYIVELTRVPEICVK